MKNYEYIAEESSTGFAGYLPALPGCVSTGASLDELEQNLREAIIVHLDLDLNDELKLVRRAVVPSSAQAS